MPVTRLATADDAPALAALVSTHRDQLARWEPHREESFFTEPTQRALLESALAGHRLGSTVPLVIVDGGTVIGRITLNGVTRGALQGASVGYWVSPTHWGGGFATRALAETITLAFGDLRLHRLQAETLLDNTASQQVLLRNGFRPYGVAPSYLKIAGRWRDHVLFHLLNED